MTEFEEIALKKIAKEYLVHSIYHRINLLADEYGISNAEISKHIGWDPAGYNQKYNRSNDLRMTTFIKIYAAIIEIVAKKENDFESYGLERSSIELKDLITDNEILVGRLFSFISAVAESGKDFCGIGMLRETFMDMRPFVLKGMRSKSFNEREFDCYMRYYKMLCEE
jgi:hypothetical protein